MPKPDFAPSPRIAVRTCSRVFRLDDLTRGAAAAGEQNAQELSEVGDRRVHAPGRRHAQFKCRGREFAAVIGPHQGVSEVLGQLRHRCERGVAHSERVDQVLAQVVGEWLLLGVLENVADGSDGGVGVFDLGAPAAAPRSCDSGCRRWRPRSGGSGRNNGRPVVRETAPSDGPSGGAE